MNPFNSDEELDIIRIKYLEENINNRFSYLDTNVFLNNSKERSVLQNCSKYF